MTTIKMKVFKNYIEDPSLRKRGGGTIISSATVPIPERAAVLSCSLE